MDIDWGNLRQANSAELKGELFGILQNLALQIQESDLDDPEILETVPRLAELIAERPDVSSYAELLSSLARAVGLWNYIDQDVADDKDAIVAGAVTIPELGGIALHREQVEALNILLAGKNLILSAPTSFGKSVLIDAAILSGKYDRIAVVLPTIALLDEFRRRLVKRFGGAFDIIMHHSEVPKKKRVIFLGTQERLINRPDLADLDLAVVDEFYKLDPNREDDRSMTLNATVYKLLRRSKQFFFLGPNIEGVRLAPNHRWRFEFLKTRFSTVAVDTYDLKQVSDRDERLASEVFKKDNWPALVFVSSPDRANKLAGALMVGRSMPGEAKQLASWIDRNYGGRWGLADMVAAGIGVHHGRIPRALASRFVKMFNDLQIPILVCTSTLIEGVNTAAKSVLIYDKKINSEPYDFFTFSNIRGRAGRLGQHHVGRVFLFHAPPMAMEIEVQTPLFGDLDEAPDELVVHIAEDDQSAAIGERLSDLASRLGLPWDEVRQVASLGMENVFAIREATLEALEESGRLVWANRPDYNEIREVAEVICKVRKPREFGVRSANQLTMYLHELRKRKRMKEFFEWHSSSFRGDDDTLDNVFKFLRACEHSLPEYFACVEIFVRKKAPEVDYSLFTAELPRWFRHEALKMLEEQGVPIQISERFLEQADTLESLSKRLKRLAIQKDERLSALEQTWIIDALPD
jgi:hypothetical protein